MQPKPIKVQCNGYEVLADWYDGTDANKGVVLVLPGFTSSKKKYRPLIRALIERTGMAMLVLDYSGHGESPFDIQDITIAENFSEVVRAYDWLAGRYPDRSISVMGTSYGGYFAAKLSGVRDVQKLILRVPANYDPKDEYTPWRKLDREQIENVYRVDPRNFDSHPVLAGAKKYRGKAYVLTHEFDQACPKSSTDPYIKAFKAETWEAKGFKHGLGESTYTQEQLEEYQDILAGWLTK